MTMKRIFILLSILCYSLFCGCTKDDTPDYRNIYLKCGDYGIMDNGKWSIYAFYEQGTVNIDLISSGITNVTRLSGEEEIRLAKTEFPLSLEDAEEYCIPGQSGQEMYVQTLTFKHTLNKYTDRHRTATFRVYSKDGLADIVIDQEPNWVPRI